MPARFLGVVLAAGLTLAAAPPSGARAADGPTAPYVVVYKSDQRAVSETRRRERQLGFRARFRYSNAIGGFAARLTSDQVASLRQDPGVAMVAPDRPVQVADAAVAEGETVPVGLRRMGAVADGLTRGPSGVGVAVIDTGVDLDNPDLNVAGSTDCTSSGTPDDQYGHGTHVAGTIGAKNTGNGVLGVAPGTPLYSVKVLDAFGKGSTANVICGIDWVTANAAKYGIKVANMSLGGAGPMATCATDPERAAICGSTAAGVTYVVAAGNGGAAFNTGLVQVPAVYPEVLTVTAMTDLDGLPGALGGPGCDEAEVDDTPASYSNYAVGPAAEAHVIAAPGSCVLSTKNGGGTETRSGTSMATPSVTGLVALCIRDGESDGPCAGMAPDQVIATVRAAAQRQATIANGFSGDPLRQSGTKYFGYLAWAGPAPRAFTGTATTIENRAATTAGSLDTAGRATQWWIEYGETPSYGSRTATQTVSGPSPQPVEAGLNGLLPGTTYHYRLAAVNDGWTAYGADLTFKTTGDPPPRTQIDTRPPTSTAAAEVTFTFSATGGPALSYECRVDDAGWEPCSSPLTFPVPDERRYTFDVRAVATDGVPDASRTAKWRVDRTAPDTVIKSGPEGTSRAATFSISSQEFPVTYACRLDGGPWEACSASPSVDGLPPGVHLFEARATDAAGNTDPSPAAWRWEVTRPTSDPASPTEPASPQPGVNDLAPESPGIPSIQPSQLVRLSKPKAAGRSATVRLGCRGTAVCKAQLQLVSAKGRVLGAKEFTLAAGGTALLQVQLSRPGVAALRSARRLPVAVRVRAERRLLGRVILRLG